MSLLSIENLELLSLTKRTIVSDVSFCVEKGEIACLVGASGSGKTLSAYAIMGLLPSGIDTTAGKIFFNNKLLTKENIKTFRAKKIGMIFQEPFSALNPVLKVGFQIEEIFRAHGEIDKKKNKEEVLALLKKVRIKDPERIYMEYPHNLSGGQRQRILIAMAISLKPDLLIADEPTTSLDVNVQADILELLRELNREMELSILFITHDLGIVRRIGDKVIVMENGKVVEQGTTQTIFWDPKKEYTKALIKADQMQIQREHCSSIEQNICEVKEVSKKFVTRSGFLSGQKYHVNVLERVNINVRKGTLTALLGQSGSGKSTLAKIMAGFYNADSGSVFFENSKAEKMGWKERSEKVQMIFQDPYNSLDPRFKMKDIIAEGLYNVKISKENKRSVILDIVRKVGLNIDDIEKYPHQFSGGQRQRIAIARALLKKPKLLILDEPVSSLDMLVQQDIVTLLEKLRVEDRLTYLFISHDVKLIAKIADYVYIMDKGYIVEHGSSLEVFEEPKKEYTKRLIQNSI